MPDSDEGGVAAHLIADEHRLVEHHGVDRHGRVSPSPALRRQTASGEIHLGEQPSAEDVAVWVGVGWHRDDAHQRQGRRKPRGLVSRRPPFHCRVSRCVNR